MPAEFRRSIFLFFKEALNNVINHSQAQCVFVAVELRDGTFEMTIKDDGIGFSTEGVIRGHGLRNMEERAKEIRAKYSLVSKPGRGTELRLSKKMT